MNAYLNFDGQCEAAFQFYQSVLGGEIDCAVRYGDMPEAPDMPKAAAEHIVHTSLKIGDNVLMGADVPSPYFRKAEGTSVTINTDTAEEADKLFTALSKDAMSIMMPIDETSWALRFAMFVDRFGTPWMINCPKECSGS